ncbi:Squamosa promoter-binding-like protein 16 [Platanthera guangdongensis]|uniref:Squamosa promoter-binding-like protein 16 n=1 Tax=Platanthera guangdongensis TaxID=2320717 RepID=A0ABR2M7L4_9ASPA
MEWSLKMPAWDLPELEQNAGEANLSSVVGSSGNMAGRRPEGLGCSVDLKLGGLGDFGLADNWKEQRRASSMAQLSPAGGAEGCSFKRPRSAPNGGGGGMKVSCLVDGCINDLSSCREYHRRHKVCEVHSKTPIVLVGGQEQRFCQQCSRFHLLAEFDEVKRSCRKRLDGHNRRRRKPQPDSVNSGNLFPNHHGSRFTYPQIFSTAATGTSWSSIIKSEEDALFSHHSQQPMHFVERVQQPALQHFGSSFNRGFKESKHFPFLHNGDSVVLGNRAVPEPAAAICQTLLKSTSSESSGGKIIFSDGLPPVLDSDSALSLLSSPAQTSRIHIGHMVPADRIPLGRPLPSSMQAALRSVSPTGFSCSGVENEHLGTVLVTDAGEADLHCHNIFHVGGEGPPDDASSHSLHFSWQ